MNIANGVGRPARDPLAQVAAAAHAPGEEYAAAAERGSVAVQAGRVVGGRTGEIADANNPGAPHPTTESRTYGQTRAARSTGIQDEKMHALEEYLRACESVAVGFSGGVDSTFLAAVCARCIPERTTLIHLNTPFIPTPERKACERSMRKLSLGVLRLNVDPLSRPEVVANPHDRCYHCKRYLFGTLMREARRRDIDVVFDGSNADDASDYRPGIQALRELGVRSPLLECGWTKDEEREVLRAWDFDVWNMPAGACLATRIASGEEVTERKLAAIRACEDRVRTEGVRQVRARLSGGIISIHVVDSEAPLISTACRNGDYGKGDVCDGSLDDPIMRNTHGETADSATVRVLLPHLMQDLRMLCDVEISPFVQPYRHGETSVRLA